MGSKARARTVYKERCGECGAKYQDRSPLGLLAKRRAHQAWHDEVDAAPEPNPTGIGHRGVDFPRAPRPGDPPWIDEIDGLGPATDPEHHEERYSQPLDVEETGER